MLRKFLIFEVTNPGRPPQPNTPGPDEFRLGTLAVLRFCISLLGGGRPELGYDYKQGLWRTRFAVAVPHVQLDGRPVCSIPTRDGHPLEGPVQRQVRNAWLTTTNQLTTGGTGEDARLVIVVDDEVAGGTTVCTLATSVFTQWRLVDPHPTEGLAPNPVLPAEAKYEPVNLAS